MKRSLLFFCSCLLTIGCGDDAGDGGQADAPVEDPACPGSQNASNPGFICPTEAATAWTFNNGAWELVGPADFSCLNTPSDDASTTVDITVTGQARDFQSGAAVADPTIEIFPGVDFGNILDSTVGDGDGNYEVVLPAGQPRIGYKISAADYLDTYLLNQSFTPDNPAQTRDIDVVSVTTANLLPAIIGIQRTAGTGVLAGAFRDCSGDTVKGVITTVSSASGSHDHVDGAQSYYFNIGLPANLTVIQATNSDGLFVVLEMNPAPTAYLQIWGFTEAQDPTSDPLTLLAEIPSPVVADSVITASVEPLRN
jgi:hypothetical protein